VKWSDRVDLCHAAATPGIICIHSRASSAAGQYAVEPGERAKQAALQPVDRGRPARVARRAVAWFIDHAAGSTDIANAAKCGNLHGCLPLKFDRVVEDATGLDAEWTRERAEWTSIGRGRSRAQGWGSDQRFL